MIFVTIVFLSSCVSQNEYDELNEKYQALKADIEETESKSMIEQSFLDSLCQKRDIDPMTGSRIPWQEAKDKLSEYKRRMRDADPNYDPKNDIYGYTFGLTHMSDLLDDIDTYNRFLPANNPNRITGIRIYKSWNFSKDPYEELFLIPVIRDKGLNVFNVDPDYTKSSDSTYQSLEIVWSQFVKEKGKDLNNMDPILNTSKPCPNLCD